MPTTTETPIKDGAALQAEIDGLRAQVEEAQTAAEFWKGKAKPDKPEGKPVEEDDDVLDVIASKGASGFEQVAKKRGFVSRDEVAGMIERKATLLTTEQQLLKTYPELGNRESDFFNATAKHFAALVKANVSEEVATTLAAEKAELDFIRAGKMQTPSQKAETERAERRARAMASQADFGTTDSTEDADELSPEQKDICRKFGITEESYKKRAKDGVIARMK